MSQHVHRDSMLSNSRRPTRRFSVAYKRLAPRAVGSERVSGPADESQKKLTLSEIRTPQIAPTRNRRYDHRRIQLSIGIA